MPQPRVRAIIYVYLLCCICGVAIANQDQRTIENSSAISRHGEQISGIERRLDQLDIEKRMVRLEIQLTEAREDISDIKRVGLAIAAAIATLVLEMVGRLIGARPKGSR